MNKVKTNKYLLFYAIKKFFKSLPFLLVLLLLLLPPPEWGYCSYPSSNFVLSSVLKILLPLPVLLLLQRSLSLLLLLLSLLFG